MWAELRLELNFGCLWAYKLELEAQAQGKSQAQCKSQTQAQGKSRAQSSELEAHLFSTSWEDFSQIYWFFTEFYNYFQSWIWLLMALSNNLYKN